MAMRLGVSWSASFTFTFPLIAVLATSCSAGNDLPDGGIDAHGMRDSSSATDGDTGFASDVAGGNDGMGSGMPSIVVTSPMQGAMVMADGAHHVSVSFTVANFTLQPEGNCGGAPNCGHVDLTIDGALCGSPYNTVASSSPATADFSRCPSTMQTGMHTIQLELRDDNFQPLTPPATAYVMVTVM
jgi:hypothetical protein